MVSASFVPNLAPLLFLAQLQQKVALVHWTMCSRLLISVIFKISEQRCIPGQLENSTNKRHIQRQGHLIEVPIWLQTRTLNKNEPFQHNQ